MSALIEQLAPASLPPEIAALLAEHGRGVVRVAGAFAGQLRLTRTDRDSSSLVASLRALIVGPRVVTRPPPARLRCIMPSPATPTFSERLRRRNALWWAVPGGWRHPSTWRRPVHRVLDLRRLRSRDWPAEWWRCCDLWQRCLLNKWNSREFAAAHGVAIPELYWAGRRVADAPLERLTQPYVIRPAFGAGGLKSHMIVAGRDLTWLTDVTPASLRRTLLREHGRLAPYPLLVEEFLPNLAGRYDRTLEYNIYVFGDRIGMVRQLLRRGTTSSIADYDEHWNRLRDDTGAIVNLERVEHRPVLEPLPRPERLGEMLTIARRLGTAVGTFIRVDLYDTPRGVVFGEFSSVPSSGEGHAPWPDRYLGNIWAEVFPDRS